MSNTTIGKIQIQLEASTAKFNADMDKAKAKIKDVHQHTVSGAQAASGVLRALRGEWLDNTTAVENFLGRLPGVSTALKAAFPIAGALGIVGVLTEMGKKADEAYEKLKQVSEAPSHIAQAFADVNRPLVITNAELQKQVDTLDNEIAKLSGKPQNGLKLALDEAIESSLKLSLSIQQNFKDLGKLLEKQTIGTLSGLLTGQASNKDVQKYFTGEKGNGGIQEKLNAALATYDNALAGVNPGSKGADAQIKALTQAKNVAINKILNDALGFVNNQLDKSLKIQEGLNNGSLSGKVTPSPYGTTFAPNLANTEGDQTTTIKELRGIRTRLLQQLTNQALVSRLNADTQTRNALKANADNAASSKPEEHQKNTNLEVALRYQSILNKQTAERQQKLQEIADIATQQNDKDEQARKTYESSLILLNQQVDAARILADVQGKGADAEYEAQKKLMLLRISDPTQRTLTGKLLDAQHAGQVNSQVAQLDRQREAHEALAKVANAGRTAQRQAEIESVKNSGQSKEIIEAQVKALEARHKLEDKQQLITGSAGDGVKRYFSEMRDNVQSTAAQVHDVLGSAFTNLNDSLAAMVSGQKVSWSSFFSGLAAQIAQVSLSNLEGKLLGGLFGGSGSKGGGGGFLGSILGGLLGHRATGGRVSAGSPYVVGELRPELFVPDQSGTIIPSVPQGTNTTGSVIHYNIDARNSTDPTMTAQSVKQAILTAHQSAVSTSLKASQERANRRPK
jgi:lambda family phage tail tape measure protein